MAKLMAALVLGAAILFSQAAAFADDSGNDGGGPGVDKYVPGDQQLQITPAQSGQ